MRRRFVLSKVICIVNEAWAQVNLDDSDLAMEHESCLPAALTLGKLEGDAPLRGFHL